MNLLWEIMHGRIERKPFALRVSVMEMISGYSSFLLPNFLQGAYGSLDNAPALIKNIFGILILILFFFELILCTKRARDIGGPGWVGTLGLLATSLYTGMPGKTIFLVLLMVVPSNFRAGTKR